jgi:hypothetical protein
MRRTIKQTEQVISAVRTKYLGHHIADTEVTALLGAAGVPSAQVAYLLSNWQIEIQGYTRTLTAAQIVKAVKLTLIQPPDGEARLMALGYSQVDADLLLQGA